jgi:hypothetical protein
MIVADDMNDAADVFVTLQYMYCRHGFPEARAGRTGETGAVAIFPLASYLVDVIFQLSQFSACLRCRTFAAGWASIHGVSRKVS